MLTDWRRTKSDGNSSLGLKARWAKNKPVISFFFYNNSMKLVSNFTMTPESMIPKYHSATFVTGKTKMCSLKVAKYMSVHFYLKRKGYAERSIIRPQHVDKGKLNKCILKASGDIVLCWIHCLVLLFEVLNMPSKNVKF